MRIPHRYLTCVATCLLLAACSSRNEPQKTSSSTPSSASTSAANASLDAAKTGAHDTVERFGKQMQKISVLAPPPAIQEELPKVYGDVLSSDLLAQWEAHPDQTVGREGSSPWPSGIEVQHVDCTQSNTCHVTGKVDYITSNEVAHGGVFMRRAIALDVKHTSAGWRIDAVQLAPAHE